MNISAGTGFPVGVWVATAGEGSHPMVSFPTIQDFWAIQLGGLNSSLELSDPSFVFLLFCLSFYVLNI